MAWRTTWLTTALLGLLSWMGDAHAQTQVKPYFVVIVDNSGSMTNWTTATPPGMNTCGREQTRMSDAKCVLQQVVNAYGDVIFALMRFRIDSIEAYNSGATVGGAAAGPETGQPVTAPAEG